MLEKPKIMSWDQAISWIAFEDFYPKRTQNSAVINAAFSTFFKNPNLEKTEIISLIETKSESLEKAAVLLMHFINSVELNVYGRRENEESTLEKIPTPHQLDILNAEFPQSPKGAGWHDLHFDTEDIIKLFSNENKKVKKKPGRKSGDGAIDDSKLLVEMSEMISSGRAKSINKAAVIIAARECKKHGSATEFSIQKRLNRKYAEKNKP